MESLLMHRVHVFQCFRLCRMLSPMVFMGYSVALHGAAVCNFHVCVCMGGGPHNFPRVPEYPVAAHAMFRVFGVDSVAHRVPRQTSMLEVSGCGAYCQTCFLDFSRGLSARNVGARRFGARCAMFSLGFKFSGSGAESGFKSSKMSALFGAR